MKDPPRAWASMAVVLAAVSAQSCSDRYGPEPLSPPLQMAIAVPQPTVSGIDLSAVRITVFRADTVEVALDSTVQLAPDQDTVDLQLEVPLSAPPPETVLVRIDLLDADGRVIYSAGPAAASLQASGVESFDVVLRYVGPGANAAGVRITTMIGEAIQGDTVRLLAEAVDSAGEPISGTPVAWTSSDATRLRILDADTGIGVAGDGTGAVQVMATLPTGLADTLGLVVFSAQVMWDQVSAGERTACGRAVDGRVFCWGANAVGQLGSELLDPVLDSLSSAPVRVAPGSLFMSVSVGGSHACGLTAAGDAYCWGGGDYGQLGVAAPPGCRSDTLPALCSTTPLAVEAGTAFGSIDAGFRFTCAIGTDAVTYCWGRNERLQLGALSTNTCLGSDCSLVPLAVSGGMTFTEVSAGFWHACAQDAGQNIYCWGTNQFGQFGNGTTLTQSGTPNTEMPEPGAGGLPLVDVFAGVQTCGIESSGAAWCWGSVNVAGQNGDSTFTGSLSPVAVVGGNAFAVLEAWDANNVLGHNCGITTASDLYCWGSNRGGQLGATGRETCTFSNETFDCSSAPILVDGGLSFRSVTTGNQFTCGVTTDGAAYCWGMNSSGQLGDGTTVNRATPVRVAEPVSP